MDALIHSLTTVADDKLAQLTDDPFGKATIAGFFGVAPPPSPLGPRYERFGCGRHAFTMRLRSLPTQEVVAFVVERCGSVAGPLMDEWRTLFDGIGGADEIAKKCGYSPEFDYDAAAQPEISRATAMKLACAIGGAPEADDLYAFAAARREPPAPRRPEQHFLEDATILTSLVRHRIPAAFAAFHHGGERLLIKFDRRGKIRLVPQSLREARVMWNGFSANNSYWLLPSFLELCGRRMIQTVGIPHLILTLLDMARLGHTRAFLKDTTLKGGTWVVDLTGIQDSTLAVTTRLIETLGPAWHDILLSRDPDGSRRRMVVQEFTPFDREHRFFCVDGRIVASTASDRTMTVFDTPPRHRRLDIRVAVLDKPARDGGHYDRGDTRRVEDRRMVARMARLVRKLLAEIQENDLTAATLLPKAFVVDVGHGPAGLGLIEINTFRNAGIYGANYDRIAAALKKTRPQPGWIKLLNKAFDTVTDPETKSSSLRVAFRQAPESTWTWQPVDPAARADDSEPTPGH